MFGGFVYVHGAAEYDEPVVAFDRRLGFRFATEVDLVNAKAVTAEQGIEGAQDFVCDVLKDEQSRHGCVQCILEWESGPRSDIGHRGDSAEGGKRLKEYSNPGLRPGRDRAFGAVRSLGGRMARVIIGAFAVLGFVGSATGGEVGVDLVRVEDAAPRLARFSTSGGSLQATWQPLVFPKISRHTDYRLVRDPGDATWVMQATSAASASGLTHATSVDLRERPILRWRWKIDGVLEKGDARRKDGDDYAARIYLTFEPRSQDLSFWERAGLRIARQIYGDFPSRAINYVWASRIEKDAIVDSAYVGAFVKLIAVESGPEHVGRWRVEERDVYADYQTLYGSDPPNVVGVAIMTDTDDTREAARAWYGDLEFLAADAGDPKDQTR